MWLTLGSVLGANLGLILGVTHFGDVYGTNLRLILGGVDLGRFIDDWFETDFGWGIFGWCFGNRFGAEFKGDKFQKALALYWQAFHLHFGGFELLILIILWLCSRSWHPTERLPITHSRIWNQLDLNFFFKTKTRTNPHIKKPYPKPGLNFYFFLNLTKTRTSPIKIFKTRIGGSSLNLRTAQHWSKPCALNKIIIIIIINTLLGIIKTLCYRLWNCGPQFFFS